MSDEKICQTVLRAAADRVREHGLARGVRIDDNGAVCILGALDECGVSVPYLDREHIEEHIRTLLPPRPADEAGDDEYNSRINDRVHHLAWWSNMIARDAEEVALKLEEAAKSC